jgi:hypothetical protein
MLRDFWLRALRPNRIKDPTGTGKTPVKTPGSRGGTPRHATFNGSVQKSPIGAIGLQAQFDEAKHDSSMTPARRTEIEELEQRNARLEGSAQESNDFITEYVPPPPPHLTPLPFFLRSTYP